MSPYREPGREQQHEPCRPWNERYAPVFFAIGAVGVLAGMTAAAIHDCRHPYVHPCEQFRELPSRDVPAKCLGYFR